VENVRQHLIPREYLKTWADPSTPNDRKGRVWIIQKADSERKELRSPRDCFWEPDRYTIQTDAGRNVAVEKALGRIESDYGRVICDVLQNRQLSAEQRVWLSFFAGAMLARVGGIPDAAERMLRTGARQTRRLEEKRGAPPERSAEMEGLLRSVHGHTASAGMIEYSKMFFDMHLSIFSADDSVGFITSDAPIFLCIPGIEGQWQHPFLAHEHVEVSLPLSPQHMGFYSWKDRPILYRSADRRKVDQFNSRTIAGCRKEFVSWKGILRPEWFGAEYR
jgi:hypothetical protein